MGSVLLESQGLESNAQVLRERCAAEQSGIEICAERDGLASINGPGVELVIWQRQLPAQFRDWIDRLDASRLPALRILVQPNELRHALLPMLDECGMTASAMRDLLVDDIDDLVSSFADISGNDLVDVRLEAVGHDACWRFHRDAVDARLITTYRGPSTEWVQAPFAELALQEQKQYDGPLERLETHDVAVFKGSRSESGGGVVHRSPPVAGTGCTRLLLCLNEPSIVSPDPWKPE